MAANETLEQHYPSEITFKSIFRTGHDTAETLKKTFSASGLECTIYSKKSTNGKFISYTLTARFSSHEELTGICAAIRALEGFMTMF